MGSPSTLSSTESESYKHGCNAGPPLQSLHTRVIAVHYLIHVHTYVCIIAVYNLHNRFVCRSDVVLHV